MATPRKRPEDKVKTGRPTKYCEEIAALICERVATHTCGLERLCSMYDDLPVKSTVNLWRFNDPEFSARYARAKMFQADLLAEECLEIADDSAHDTISNKDGYDACDNEWVNRCRLRIDTRKWLAAKLLPKQYGVHADDKKSVSESLVEKLIDKLIE